jgi:predicted RNA binding protein YcfA (HicA-like mRNA interferase family)
MKVQEILQKIQADGWYIIEEKGSFRQYKHTRKRGRITITGNLNYDFDSDAVNSILLQAGLQGRKS